MKKLILLSTILLTGCFGQTTYIGDTVPQEHYGEECFEKPYTNKYGDSYLCQANAIAKHNKQVDLHNKVIEK